MDLLYSILTAKRGKVVSHLSMQFALPEDQTIFALEKLLLAVAHGLHTNISQGGLDELLRALKSGRHGEYLDHPSTLFSENAREDGNAILGHILGSKDISKQVAAQAAARTGISQSTLEQMLPAVAALAMSSLSKRIVAAAAKADILHMLAP
jgi:hypothetical protein